MICCAVTRPLQRNESASLARTVRLVAATCDACDRRGEALVRALFVVGTFNCLLSWTRTRRSLRLRSDPDPQTQRTCMRLGESPFAL
eukprot:6179066-Pleurochrysis_carterae.AAC.1